MCYPAIYICYPDLYLPGYITSPRTLQVRVNHPPPHSIPWKASCLLITIPAVSGQVILKKGPYLWEGSSRKKHKENN